ncbi:MAG TPA: Rrf2 family transcriptional regulator [Epulopiscium sp.]|nr:Rrf2 family transcriptional regulator [Candidatus Epulonipiscium sp.]
MRISAKGRYGLASMIYMAQLHHTGECITIIRMAEALDISKIYLEQVFSLLKRAEIVTSIKGAQGGYKLIKAPNETTAFDILSAIEMALFEETEETVASVPAFEAAMQKVVFEALSSDIKASLEKVTLYDLVVEAEKQRENDNFMFFI